MTDDFDPHMLDWSRHRRGPAHAERGPGTFLADAAEMMGQALLEGWTGGETTAIGYPAPPLPVPAPDEAFDRAGEPVAGVHRAFGAMVLDRVGHGKWESLSLRARDRSAWLASHVPDPEGGAPLPAAELADRGATGEIAAISEDHWNEAHADIETLTGTRKWALHALSAVSQALGDLAAADDKAVGTFARPLAGGPSISLNPGIWHVGHELRMRRLAACGLNLKAPFDALAPIDHLLFLQAEDLPAEIFAYAAPRREPVLPDNHHWWERDAWPRVARYGDLEGRIRAELERVLQLPENRFWRAAQACEHIAGHPAFGQQLDGVVRRVCADLQKVENVRYASLGKPGRPRMGLQLRPKRAR